MSVSPKEDERTSWLSDKEKYALDYFIDNLKKDEEATGKEKGKKAVFFPISPAVQAQLYAIFLQGRTLEDIRKSNPSYSLGQIVHAAVENGWYKEKKDYQTSLMQAAKERVKQIELESATFLADSLAAAHKQHGEALRKYLQTGNLLDLGAFGIGSIRQYREVAELLLKVTGQGATNTTNVNVNGAIEHVATSDPFGGDKPFPTLKELASRKKAKAPDAD